MCVRVCLSYCKLLIISVLIPVKTMLIMKSWFTGCFGLQIVPSLFLHLYNCMLVMWYDMILLCYDILLCVCVWIVDCYFYLLNKVFYYHWCNYMLWCIQWKHRQIRKKIKKKYICICRSSPYVFSVVRHWVSLN